MFWYVLPVFGVLLLLFNSVPAVATDYNSAHFDSRDPITSDSGGFSTSSSFQQINAVGQTTNGESTSTNFTVKTGFLYFDTFTPRSQKWRWYSDISNETPVTGLAAENVAPSAVNNGDSLKLRVTIKETGNAGDSKIKYKLQYSQTSDFAIVSDVVGTSTCISTSVWCYAQGAGADNAVITTKTLSDADACSSSTGQGCGTHNSSSTTASTFTQLKNAATEFEFTVKDSGAAQNTTYFFRVYDVTHSMPVATNASQSYPSLATIGATLTFSISGLDRGTATGGVTTDATTTATAIPFGHLPLGTAFSAAQRLTVSTSATQGYQVFVLQQQGLTGPSSIAPVPGTNTAPATFAIPNGATGAYGYHTTAAALAGGSTRFAVNDSYAKFDSVAGEIAYSSGPVTNQSTDIVVKTQVTNQQPAGQYSGSIVYIVVPVF